MKFIFCLMMLFPFQSLFSMDEVREELLKIMRKHEESDRKIDLTEKREELESREFIEFISPSPSVDRIIKRSIALDYESFTQFHIDHADDPEVRAACGPSFLELIKNDTFSFDPEMKEKLIKTLESSKSKSKFHGLRSPSDKDKFLTLNPAD